jgi:hypothetical protein
MFKSYTQAIQQTPWRIACIKKLLKTDRQILALRPGKGKTALCYAVVKLQKLKTLVISTKQAIENEWLRQYAQWDEFKGLNVVSLRDGFCENFDVACINYEQLHNLKKLVDLKTIQCVVLDESASVKHLKSNRTRRVVDAFQKNFDVKIIMCDGVLSGERILDAYNQLKVLSCHEKLGVTQSQFKAFYPTLIKLEEAVLPDNEIKFKNEVASFAKVASPHIFAQKEVDVSQYITDKFYNIVPDKATHDAIKSMLNGYILQIAENTNDISSFIHAPNQLAVRQKILQICSGAVYKNTKFIDPKTQEYKEVVYKDQDDRSHFISSNKVKFLRSLLNTNTAKPMLVVYRYKIDKAQIQQEFGTSNILEDLNEVDSTRLIKKFRNGEIPHIFINFQKHCKGINLHGACNDVVMFTQSEVYNVYRQAIGRVWNRGDVLNKLTVHHLITHSIEKKLFEMRKAKQHLDITLNDKLAAGNGQI